MRYIPHALFLLNPEVNYDSLTFVDPRDQYVSVF